MTKIDVLAGQANVRESLVVFEAQVIIAGMNHDT